MIRVFKYLIYVIMTLSLTALFFIYIYMLCNKELVKKMFVSQTDKYSCGAPR